MSEWGTTMGEAIIFCTLFSLCLLPHAVAMDSIFLGGVCVLTTTLPLCVLWAPAAVSSVCDDLLDQLNDISFLGNHLHRVTIDCCDSSWNTVRIYLNGCLCCPVCGLGDETHKARCTNLRYSLTNLNRAQGLGFKMFGGTVIDKRFLVKVMGGVATGSVTIISG